MERDVRVEGCRVERRVGGSFSHAMEGLARDDSGDNEKILRLRGG